MRLHVLIAACSQITLTASKRLVGSTGQSELHAVTSAGCECMRIQLRSKGNMRLQKTSCRFIADARFLPAAGEWHCHWQ